MKTVSDVLKTIKDKDVKYVDLRFTDTKGKMQHVTADASCIDEGGIRGIRIRRLVDRRLEGDRILGHES